MNTTLITALWRQRAASPVRMVLLLSFLILPLLVAVVAPGHRSAPEALTFVLILGAGMVGQDVSSGVLAGVFARPVRRSEYVLNRWLAVSLAVSALVLLQAAAGCAVQAAGGAHPDFGAAASRAAGAIFQAWGASAVLLLFSCGVNGFGDLAVFLLITVLGKMLVAVGSIKSWAAVGRAGTELQGFVNARLEVGELAGASFSAFAIASYLSTIALCLALAIILVNRKELSYAAG